MTMDMLIVTQGGPELVFNATASNIYAYMSFVTDALRKERNTTGRRIRDYENQLRICKDDLEEDIYNLAEEGIDYYTRALENLNDSLKQINQALTAWTKLADHDEVNFGDLCYGANVAPNEEHFDTYRYLMMDTLINCVRHHGNINAYVV